MKTAAVLAMAIAAAGCASAPPLPPALCEVQRDPSAGAPDAGAWLTLLLKGYDPSTRRVTKPALDCTGAQVRWDGPVFSCEDGGLALTALPDRPLGGDDVLTTSVSSSAALVWIPTNRFASGDALGPVALVDWAGSRLRVMAIGSLRAHPQRVRMRLESMEGTKVLVAEGEQCASADPASCARGVRIVPLRQDRFLPEPLLGGDGRCQSPAWFDLARHEQVRAGDRLERRELTAALTFDGAGLTVEEQFVVQDLGSRPGGTARVLHRAQSSRTVRFVSGRLVGSGPSLWSRMTAGGSGGVR